MGAAFEFICGYLGEHLLQVTFWDYSGVPLHIGTYINLPFCLAWGVVGILWVRKVYPLLTEAALLRMHERQQQKPAVNYAEYMLDRCFSDQILQQFFPKMKSTVTGEKIYVSSKCADVIAET